MGRLDDAREIIARLRAITPVVVPDVGFLRNPEHRELFLSGLRLAAGDTVWSVATHCDPAQVDAASMTCGVVAVHLSRCADCSRIFVQSAAAGNWRSCSFN